MKKIKTMKTQNEEQPMGEQRNGINMGVSMFDLHGKTAMVTGGAQGLGRGITQGLAEAGARVIILDISEHTERVAAEFRDRGDDVYPMIADLTGEEAIKKAYQGSMEILGGSLDILVNAAGIQRRNKAQVFLLDDWNAVLELNLTSVFLLCREAGSGMLKRGRGKIINLASMLSFFGGINACAYAASKGAVAQLTKALSNEWACKGINVNAIAPGYMDTPMNAGLKNDPVRNEEILKRIPAGRWGNPDDLKGICIFLASEASDYLHGAVIPVDGGYLGR
jgi:2-dehydro-3-deoxy-D-gluconate 5-dehydrogenase